MLSTIPFFFFFSRKPQLLLARVLQERRAQPLPVEDGGRLGPQKVLRVPLPPAAGAAEDGAERRVRGRDAGGRRRHHHADRVQGVPSSHPSPFFVYILVFFLSCFLHQNERARVRRLSVFGKLSSFLFRGCSLPYCPLERDVARVPTVDT